MPWNCMKNLKIFKHVANLKKYIYERTKSISCFEHDFQLPVLRIFIKNEYIHLMLERSQGLQLSIGDLFQLFVPPCDVEQQKASAWHS
jgi:hypothetical protein